MEKWVWIMSKKGMESKLLSFFLLHPLPKMREWGSKILGSIVGLYLEMGGEKREEDSSNQEENSGSSSFESIVKTK